MLRRISVAAACIASHRISVAAARIASCRISVAVAWIASHRISVAAARIASRRISVAAVCIALRRISAAAACIVTLALGALPASAATSHVHAFSIPGVYGVRAWGNYQPAGASVRVTVCVQDAAPDVYGAAAVGLTFDPGYRHHIIVSAVTIGYAQIQCRVLTSTYTGHLVVEALSGYTNGKVRQHGRPKRIY